MNIQFTARHFQASDSLKSLIIGKTEDLTKYYENIISAHIILDAEDKIRKAAELIIQTRKRNITSKGTGENMGIAIDGAFTKVERQLKKLNEKIKNHKERGFKSIAEPKRSSQEEYFE